MPPRPSPLLRFLLATVFTVAGGAAARAQSTLPTGGHVVAGNASIGASSGNTLSITQTSPKAVVNWNSFSVGQPNTVNFAQPNSSAAILNQVTGTTPSTIAGQINANGQVYLVNPNGVAITPSGSVQVGGGFVASTLGISNQDFMNGNLSFTGNGASAGVSNAGSIAAGPGGYVGLIGGTAANSGVISVPLGKVALGSGEAATLDLNGGGFLQVAVPTGATTARGQALVSNSGKVNAAGGTVELRAATVATAIRAAVNMSGTISATSISGRNGAITLSGGPGGAVNVSGALDASAPPVANQPRANGGSITVSGARVRIGHHAVLNASGAKGGSVLVGVTAPGGVDAAQSTTIAPGATILAMGDPTVAGSGGYIETSGGTLKFGGATINAGNGGTWLSDPTDLTIDTAAATAIDNALKNNNNVIEETAGDGTTVGSGNTSSGPGDIIVDAALGWNTSATLTLTAFNGITVNAPITVGGAGHLVLRTNNNINGTSTGAGALVFTLGEGSAQYTSEVSNPTLKINGTLYTLIFTANELNDLATTVSGGIGGGSYAIATNIDASSINPFPMIGNAVNSFSGTFNGLGNTISNLTISAATGDAGLFATLTGSVSNLILSGGSITGVNEVGALAGVNEGTIANVQSSAAVTGVFQVGGLVGDQLGGSIGNSSASGAVTGESVPGSVGGLVGELDAGSVTGSGASGSVTAPDGTAIGGLIGLSNAGTTVSNSFATGNVTATQLTNQGNDVGGLIGDNASTVTNSFATGTVTGGGNDVGGLIGINESSGGAVSNSFASGSVTAGGMDVGGLIGLDNGASTTTNVFATGSVTGADNVGGLIGELAIFLPNTLTNAYSTGAVSGTGGNVHGLIGINDNIAVLPNSVTNAYYDACTALADCAPGSSSLGPQADGSIGKTTADLQTDLTSLGFPSSDWGIVPGKSYPYLCWQFAGCGATPQVVSGTVYQNFIGTIPAGAGITVTGLINGSQFNSVLTGGTVTTGANGYYYYLLAPNTIPSGGGVLTYAQNYPAGAGTASGAAFADGITSGSATGLTIFANTLHEITPDAENSTLQGNLATALGSNALPTGLRNLQIDASASVFDIDTAVSNPFGTVTLNAGGAITESMGSITARSLLVNAVSGVDLSDPNAVGTLAANVTGPGASFDFLDFSSINVAKVGGTSGITTNDGDVALATEGSLRLLQPINTNNGSMTLGSSPGFVSLNAFDDITERTSGGNNGVIVAGSLFAASLNGNVELTAPNHIGANDNAQGVAQTPGLIAGETDGSFNANFQLVNHNAGIQVDTVFCGCAGILSNGQVDLATTGAGSIVVNQPINALSTIEIAVAPGYGFTNNVGNNFDFGFPSAGIDTSGFGGAPIVILADGMNLSGGTINAGFAPILLGPASLNTNVSLGTPSIINPDGTTSGPLGLSQADINSITAAFLQIGYRNVDGSVSFNGTIDVASNIQINTNNINDGFGDSTLLLVTGGAVTESGGALGATGPNTLSLGVLAGSATMNQNNAVGTLAAFTDGMSANFSFVNSGQALAIDALSDPQAGLFIDRHGFPIAVDMFGAAPNPLDGIITANGNVSITVANSGALTINQPIDAGTGSVTAASAGDLTIGAFGSVMGNTITLATLGNFTNNAGAGALTVGPSGEWLIYSTNPLDDNDGGLTPDFIQYAATYPVGAAGSPTLPDASGNGFLYSITPTVTVDSVTKVYDGTANLPTDVGHYTIGGGFNGDTVSLVASGATGLYASPSVGRGIDVTLTGLSINATNMSGIPVYGYGVVAANSGAIGTITPATLTASLTGTISKVYDGTTNASLTSDNFSLSGFVVGQGATVLPLIGTYNSSDVATATTIMASLVAGDFTANAGTLLSNYTLPTIASGAGSITPATLTASIIGNPTKVYDGTVNASLVSANFSLSGFVAGQGAAFSPPSFGAYNSSDVATANTVTANLTAGDFMANAGTNLGNYTLPTIASGAGSITRATLTASIVGNPRKVYDGTTSSALNPANFSLSGFIAGQGASVLPLTGAYNSPDVATATTVTANLLTGDFTANAGTNLGNYTLPAIASGGGAITPATLTASIVGNPTKIYDGTANASLTSGNFSLAGFIAGQGATVLPLTGAYNSSDVATATTVTASLMAGDFTATAGTNLGNYTLPTIASGAGSITPATLTASIVGNPIKDYDGTTSIALNPANFSLAGFIAGQGATVLPLTGAYNSPDVATATTVTANLVPGDFTANAGTSFGNYALPVIASGAGSIIPATLTIAANDLTRFIGQPNPQLTYTIMSGSLFNGDTLSGSLTTSATAASIIGSYPITQGTLANSDYRLIFIDGTLTIVAFPGGGVSPLLYTQPLIGRDGLAGTGTNGSNQNLTNCSASSVAALLQGSGKATLFGGGACSSL